MLNLRRCRDQLLYHKSTHKHMIACMSAVCMAPTDIVLQTQLWFGQQRSGHLNPHTCSTSRLEQRAQLQAMPAPTSVTKLETCTSSLLCQLCAWCTGKSSNAVTHAQIICRFDSLSHDCRQHTHLTDRNAVCMQCDVTVWQSYDAIFSLTIYDMPGKSRCTHWLQI